MEKTQIHKCVYMQNIKLQMCKLRKHKITNAQLSAKRAKHKLLNLQMCKKPSCTKCANLHFKIFSECNFCKFHFSAHVKKLYVMNKKLICTIKNNLHFLKKQFILYKNKNIYKIIKKIFNIIE